MKKLLGTMALIAALCVGVAAPVSAAYPARPFAGHDRVADTMLAPSGCPAGASWRYSATGTGWFLHRARPGAPTTHGSSLLSTGITTASYQGAIAY